MTHKQRPQHQDGNTQGGRANTGGEQIFQSPAGQLDGEKIVEENVCDQRAPIHGSNQMMTTVWIGLASTATGVNHLQSDDVEGKECELEIKIPIGKDDDWGDVSSLHS